MDFEQFSSQLSSLPTTILTSVAIVVVVTVALIILTTKPKAPEGLHLPPVWSSGIPIVGSFVAFASDPLGTVWRAREKCGNVFTIKFFSENCTFLVGSEAHSYFFSASDEQLDQAEVYQFMVPIFGKGIIYDAPLHKRRQQLRGLASALKPSELKKYPAIIAKETHDYLEEKWGDEGEIDLLPSMAELIILTASATLLGPEVRNELFLEVSHLYETLDKGLTPFGVFFPNAPIPAHKKRDEARTKISQLFSKVVRRRKENPEQASKNIDLLQKLIDFRYKDGTEFEDDEICGMLIAALFAGQHTSSITTTWTTLLLLDAANKGETYLAEILDELAESESHPGAFAQGVASHTDIGKESKLYAAVKEAIRMYPPLIFLMRRVLEPVTMADGTYVPKGHRVMVSNAVAQMLPEIFENPKKYDPTRWTDFDITKFPKYSFVGFGSGIHTCMGEPFAFMQIRTILSVLFSKYEITFDGEAPQANYEAMVVPPKGPNVIKYKRRANVQTTRKQGGEESPAPVPASAPAKQQQEMEKGSFGDESSQSYTIEEISKHCTVDDLWLIVNDKVYDVTNYVDVHQGGENALLKWSGGKDATEAVFGPQHPNTIATLIERFHIGNVKRE